VDASLGQHAVVLEFTLPQGRSVASNDDQLGLAGSQRLESRLVAESDWQNHVRIFAKYRRISILEEPATYPFRTS
jgi:hypothetical protein